MKEGYDVTDPLQSRNYLLTEYVRNKTYDSAEAAEKVSKLPPHGVREEPNTMANMNQGLSVSKLPPHGVREELWMYW